MHKCRENYYANDMDLRGYAINECSGETEDDKFLWVFEGDYVSRVNYCPYCGYKAKEQMKER